MFSGPQSRFENVFGAIFGAENQYQWSDRANKIKDLADQCVKKCVKTRRISPKEGGRYAVPPIRFCELQLLDPLRNLSKFENVRNHYGTLTT